MNIEHSSRYDIHGLIALNGYHHYRMALMSAHNAPRGRIIWERLQNPRKGDLVIETTAGRRLMNRGEYEDNILGFLLTESSNDGVKIKTLEGREIAWENCSFVAVMTPDLDREIRELIMRGEAKGASNE